MIDKEGKNTPSLSEELIREANDKYYKLINSIDQGFCIFKMLFDENGRAYDYIFLETNSAFEKQTGLKNAMGKSIKEMVPDHEQHWIDTYGMVASTGQPMRLEGEAKGIGYYYDIYAFRIDDQNKHVAALFSDITQRKKAEERQAFLLKLSDAIRPLSDAEKILEQVTGITMDFYGANRCYYSEIEGDISIIRRDAYQDGLQSVAAVYSLNSMPLLKSVIDTGKTFIAENVQRAEFIDDNLKEITMQMQIASFIAVPVIKNNRPAGIFSITWDTPVNRPAMEVELAEEIAERTWSAVERAHTENSLRESEQHLHSIANLVPDLLWSRLPDGSTDWYNHRWMEYTGQTSEEAINSDWADPIHPDDREAALASYKEAMTTGKLLRQEHRIRRHDGDYRWFVVQAQPLRSATGNILRWFGAATDIHESRTALEALKKSEERFQMATKAADAFSWEHDLNADKISYSGDAAGILDISKGNKLPENLDEIVQMVHDDDKERVLSEFLKARVTADIFNFTFQVKRNPSETIWMEIYGRVFRSDEGKAERIIGIAQNITRRMLIEQALHDAIKDARVAARVKDDFLSTMSHEIRTPLNAIIGLSNLLLKKNPRPEQLENLNTLKFSSLSLLTLINDILDYSKLEAGKTQLESLDYSLSTLVNSLRQAHLVMVQESNNELYFNVDPNVPDVLKGDPHKLVQVLNNLISNAMKFTQNGSVSLKISLEKKHDKTVWLHFAVADTGVGISEKKLHAIFEKFTQADSSTVRRYGGTGLGLSITRSLLELMGSGIKVKSKQGEGSEFSFVLRQETGCEKTWHGGEAAPVLNETQKIKNPMNILLVDDSPFNRLVLQQHLEEWWRLQADEAGDGLEALGKVQQKKYDLILMDIRMPEMDGMEATRRIRKMNAHYAQVPVIIITADDTVKKREDTDYNIFDAIIIKPFEPEQLRKAIAPFILADSGIKEQQDPDDMTSGKEHDDSFRISTPDFTKLEQIFKSSESAKKRFLNTVIASLQNYQMEFLHAMKKGDAAQLDDVIHKARMVFNTFGMDEFYHQMVATSRKIKEGAPPDFIESAILSSDRQLEHILTVLNKKLKQ
jgi:PAS domain S-box-containing protein